MNYIDIHSHLDDSKYDADRSEVLGRMREAGVGTITIGTDLESSKRAVEIAEQNENVWACVGIHPNTEEKFDKEEFEKLVKSPKVVAVGECGLDWFRTSPENLESERARQTTLFESQIQFALEFNKPLMLHCRNAYDDVLEVLRRYPGAKGNVHFFAGSVEQAKKFLDLGFTMSFTGVITFTSDYDEVIKSLPLDAIMSETDAPYVAPTPYRGKRNEPYFVPEVVKRMAEIKGQSPEDLNLAIIHNAERLFGLK